MFDKIFDWYLWYFPFLAIMGFLHVQQKNKYLASDEGKLLKSEDDYRVGWIFAVLTFLPLIWLAGSRGWEFANRFGDTGQYIESFKQTPSSIGEALSKIDWDSRSPGFEIFRSIIKQFFGDSFTVYFWIIALICGLSLVIIYRYYRADIVMCAFLFFASSDFMSWMMNGCRQFLVVSLLFLAFPLIQKRKYVPFLIIVIVLFTIHRSALLVIPLYIASLGKPFNKRTMIVLVLSIAAILFAGQFTDMMDEGLQGTVYSNMVSEFEGDDGTNIIRALVYSIPAIIALFNREKLDDDTPEIIKISVNMALITAGLYFLSVPISGIYMGRLPIYCSLFNYILLPWELKHFFKEDLHKILSVLMIVLYLVFFAFQMDQWKI